jgi:Xaa-Pro aminopeptidase
MSDDVYAARRARVLATLAADRALLVAAGPELRVGADGELRYLPDSDVYYLSGYTEPEAVLLLCPAAASPFTVFVRPRDPERERWTGARAGIEAAPERLGAAAAHDIAELSTQLPKLLESASTLYCTFDSGRADVDAAVRRLLEIARRARPRAGRGVQTVTDTRALLAPMRLRKDAHELELIRQAARITVDGFDDAAAALCSAAGEWQVEATIEHAFRRRGAMGSAFPTIAAGGAHATVLHYVANDNALRRGDLLLLDAGARYRMYCADVTRTYPVGGTFSAPQRAVYDVVLAAHDAALAAIAPGRGADELHDAALRVLVDGMRELGLLAGDTDALIEQEAFKRYYPHRTSHWLGLDVHDVGDYANADGTGIPLEPGMVLTVEPGLYVPADDDSAPAAVRGIGVRLEDDVLVTASGHEVLTGALPIRAEEVESLAVT